MFQKYRPECPHLNQVVEQCVKLSHDHNIYDSSVNSFGVLTEFAPTEHGARSFIAHWDFVPKNSMCPIA